VHNVGLHHEPSRPETVLMRWFDAPAWLSLAQEHGTQIAALVPSMLSLLLTQPLEEHDLSELRFAVSGAAPLARETIDELRRRLPGGGRGEGCGRPGSCGRGPTNPPGAVRHGTVGPAVPGAELRIVGDDGQRVPAGQPGEVCVRSPMVMAGYWRAPDVTDETLH